MAFGAIALWFLLRLAEALPEGPLLALLLLFVHVVFGIEGRVEARGI